MRIPIIASRYAAWIDRNRWMVMFAGLVVAVASLLLALKLPLKSDFATLLPPESKSVVQLRALQVRARAFGTLFVVVESDDPALRRRATDALYERLQKIDGSLVAHVGYDDGAKQKYFWDNRFLFADLEALIEARDTLEDKVRQAKLDANPLFVDLDDEDEPAGEAALEDRVAELRKQLDEAEARLKKPPGFVSRDGRLQLLTVRATAPSSDIKAGKKLIAAVKKAIAETQAELPLGQVSFGPTGSVVSTQAEHQAVVRGMMMAAIITVLLCAIALFWFYRSGSSVLMSLWSLTVGVLATFAVTKLVVGHLNVVTAFLAAIVVGNGINAGLILLARYQEELRKQLSPAETLAGAMAGAARGTLAASLAAGVAYGSLVVTEFRGFQDFGVIGGVGMVLCWLSAFTVLPAGLAILQRKNLVRVQPAGGNRLGLLLARAFPRNRRVVVAVGAGVLIVSAAVSWHYVASDPMEDDWRALRSDSARSTESERWYQMVQHRFERDHRQGLAGRFAIAVDDPTMVPGIVSMLKAVDEGKPPEKQLLAQIVSIDELLPADQERKLELLDQIRAIMDDEGVDELDREDRDLIEPLRPPDDMGVLTYDDIPGELSWPFIERDGTIGRIILATSAPRFKTWIVDHRVEFAAGVRALGLPEGALIGGQAFVVADIIAAMERDGPRATLAAIVGAVLMVWLVVGRGRHGAITLFSGAAGLLGMVALLHVFGVKINFLDFIALPITIGIGIDYSVNIAVREQQEGDKGTRHVLATMGATVVLCSYTTIVGYGSLLLSDNAGIRSFGKAAILGEFACIAMAVLLTPALLGVMRNRRARLGTRDAS